jgi:hypothetical protein
MHALRADEQARRLLELAICGKRHPEGRKVVWSALNVHGGPSDK